ncbi:GGDEF domain-containing protein [Qipengyuania sp.]|uniref:GGDEF domain-containing protein n=1 Tax=Qipengyuania sp. TaxID=2004515 RepID=UPI003AF8066A
MFALSFGAVHIPLVAYLVLEALRGSWDWSTFLALLVATVVGSGFAIAGLAGLLAPVAVATRGLRALRDGVDCEDIPTGGPDMAGELLESVAHALRSTSARLDELKDLALTDPLTGLLNRRGFAEVLGQDPKASGTLAVLDGDRFKQVNDSLGHAEGDRLLRTLADRLKDRTRPQDIAARWGGDEFVVFFKDTSVEEAGRILKRIQLSLRFRPIAKLDGRPVSFSVGLAPIADSSIETVEAAVRNADAEMYGSKRGQQMVEA